MSGRQIVVEIVGDEKKFTQATGNAVHHSEHLSGKLHEIGKGMAIGAGIGVFSLASGGLEMMAEKADEAHKAFLEDDASAAKLAQSLKNNIPNFDGNAEGANAFAESSVKLGFSAAETRDSLGRLVGVTHDVEEAQKLSQLAMDISRAKGIDLAKATMIVTRAHEGNGKALKGLGVDIAGAKTGADFLAAAQKNVAGAADAWANTNTGKLAASNASVEEGMIKIGGVIDKVSQVAVPLLASAFTTIIDVAGTLISAASPIVHSMMPGIQAGFKAVSSFVTGTLAPAFKVVAAAVLPALGAAFQFISKNVLPAVGQAIQWISRDVVPPLKVVLGVLGDVGRQVFSAIGTAVKVLGPIVGTVFGAMGTAAKLISSVIRAEFGVVQTAIGILQTVFTRLGSIVGGVFSSIGGFVRGGINAVIGAVNGVIDAINGIQVHVHVGPVNYDFDGLNIRHIPKLHSGGYVPGPMGAEVPVMLQAGELVTSIDQLRGGGGSEVHIHIDQGAYIDGPSVDRLALLLSQRMRLQGIG